MHRSKLCAILIDCQNDTINNQVNFWSSALGKRPIRSADPSDPYVSLESGVNGLKLELQRVNAPSRIHLDIETDNVEAEVQRLEKIGALRVEKVESWWIMRDPAGLLFCVVPPQTEDFLEKAAIWAD